MNDLLRTAEERDWPVIHELLAARGLPLDGARQHLENFVVAEKGRAVVGVGGSERYGQVGLLRSVAVVEAEGGTGIGTLLVRELLARARQAGVRDLYLLTTSAAEWFPRFGFVRIDRAAMPPELGASAELQGACPASAVAMRLKLQPRG